MFQENQIYIDWANKQLGAIDEAKRESHGDQSAVFKLRAANKNYFLKIGSGLEKERERLEWLDGKLPVPRVIGFASMSGKDALLLSALEGVNLAVLKKEWPVEKVIDALVDALQRFHAVDISDCPFGTLESNTGQVLVHGDACLPNFIFQDGELSGYVDIGDMSIGSVDRDLSAAVWSLQYNLGAGYGARFLEKYGIQNVTEELVETLRLRYEDMQEKWGLSK